MKNKVLLEATGIFFVLFFLIYLLGAFGQWHINPGKWQAEARGIVAGMGGVFSLFVAALRIVFEKTNKV